MGGFRKTTAQEFIEAIGYAGFDFVSLDMEHGAAQFETQKNLIRAAESSGVPTIVRTRDRSPENVAQPLDPGAAGGVQNRREAIIDAANFAPLLVSDYRVGHMAPRSESFKLLCLAAALFGLVVPVLGSNPITIMAQSSNVFVLPLTVFVIAETDHRTFPGVI